MIRSDMELLHVVDAVRELNIHVASLHEQMDMLSTFDEERQRVRSVKNALEIDLNSYIDEINEYLKNEENFMHEQRVAADMLGALTEMAKRMAGMYSSPESQEEELARKPIHIRQNPVSLIFELDDDEDECGCVDACGWRCECGCHEVEPEARLNRPENEVERQAGLNTEARAELERKNASRVILLRNMRQAIKPVTDNPELYATPVNVDRLCNYIIELETMCSDLINGK